MGKTLTTDAIQLRWSDRERRVVISQEDQDRFVMNVEEVIAACRAYDPERKARIYKAMRRLMDVLGAWAKQHAKKISHAFVTTRDASMLFLVVTRRRRRDPTFEDELTGLDLSIVRDAVLRDLSVSVLAIPHCGEDGYRSFIDEGFCYVYQGLHAR